MEEVVHAEHGARPLGGLRVCMLLIGDPLHDSRVRKEAMSLVASGAAVDIVYSSRRHESETDWEWGSAHATPVAAASDSRFRLPRVARNLWSELRVSIRMATAAKSLSADVYHCHDLNTLWPGMRAAKATGARVVYDAHELFTEAVSWKPWRRRVYARFERRALGRVDLTIAANPERAEVMAREYGAPSMPAVIVNAPEARLIGLEPTPDALEARTATGAERILLYQGGVHPGRGLDAVVGGLSRLPKGLHLAIMGSGDTEGLKRTAHELGVADRVHVWPFVPTGDVISWAAVADAGIVSYVPTNRNNELCAPNKLFDYAAAGIPIVAADLPPLRGILSDRPDWLFVPGDSESFAAAALAALAVQSEGEARDAMLELARMNAWEHQAKTLVARYAKLADGL